MTMTDCIETDVESGRINVNRTRLESGDRRPKTGKSGDVARRMLNSGKSKWIRPYWENVGYRVRAGWRWRRMEFNEESKKAGKGNAEFG
jgi:hypothetical protein